MIKKTLTFALAFLLFLTNLGVALAAQSNQLPTEGIQSSDPLIGRSSDYNFKTSPFMIEATTSSLFFGWACQIVNNGNGTVQISGYTEAVTTVNNIQVTVYLQKWNGTNWVDLTYVTKSATGIDYVSAAKDVSVTSGYYRSRATHYISNGTSESKSTTSSYITIN